jgi:hypothetical protein
MSSANPRDDGLVNVSAAITMIATAPFVFVAGVPLTNFITAPGGIFEKLLNGIIGRTTFIGTAGT